MVVDASCRGGGAGSSLLLAAIESARRAGCLRITLLTDTSNRLAQTFYARHGFVLSDMVPMRRQLD
jgi:ribosomal protein S18 acetylase RimI-like enzyme